MTASDRAAFHQQVPTEGPVHDSDAFALSGMIFEGRFRIEDRIAEGGFAVVYRACQVALDRRVALKILKRRGHDDAARAEFREKFASEARTIARLRHPHIVDVYDYSVSALPSGELVAWMALEWLEGETLSTHLARRRAEGKRGRTPQEALELFRPVLVALVHAHKHAIVHRDIKPANIMVTQTAHGPSLRVLDFGIAKIMADDRAPNTGNTRTESAPAFSPAYAAPEQVNFSRTGPWTDVHALGLILSELMTDEAPFSQSDPDMHVFEQVMAADRPTPGRRGRDVGLFEAVIAKALALSPRDRWKDAGELLAALDDAAAGKAVAAPPAPAPAAPAIAPRAARRRAPLVAAGLLAAVVVAGVVFVRGRVSAPAGAAPAASVSTPAPVPVRPAAPPVPAAAAVAPEGSPAPERLEPSAPMPAPAGGSVRRKASAKARPPAAPEQKPPPAPPRDLFDDIR